MKAPKPKQLWDLEHWFQAPTYNKAGETLEPGRSLTARLIATLARGVHFPVGKSLKRLEELKNYPKGTFFKLVKHP